MWKGESLDRVLDVCRSGVNKEILRILANSDRGAYPSQLARRLGKDRTLVNRRLRRLHDLGLVRRRYEVREGKGVMIYRANQSSITIAIDFKAGETAAFVGEDGQRAFGARIIGALFRIFPPIVPPSATAWGVTDPVTREP